MDLDLSKVKTKMNAAAGVIFKEGDNYEQLVLLIQRAVDDHWPQFWEFPRGKCDQPVGENLVKCCKREIKEETGLDVEVRGLIDKFQYLADKGTRLTTCYNFYCTLKNPDQKVKLSKEHMRFKWAQSVGEIEMLLLPDQKKTVEKIFNKDIQIVSYPENEFTKNNMIEEKLDRYLRSIQ